MKKTINNSTVKRLNEMSKSMRQDILEMSKSAGDAGVHFGGTLSMIEIAASLYGEVMNISKDSLNSEERDRFILSKGHGVPALYAALHQIDVIDDEKLHTFKMDGTELGGHPCMNADLGIEFSSGSLGQGLSLGVGTALALRHKGNNKSRVFVVLGDGECDEGSVWEAAMSASHYGLNNLIAIIDRNHLQYDGDTEIILGLDSLEEKWRSFGWDCINIDGHDVKACCEAFQTEADKPLAVIANTIKGKGISFMEGDPSWHNKKLTPAQEEMAREEVDSVRY